MGEKFRGEDESGARQTREGSDSEAKEKSERGGDGRPAEKQGDTRLEKIKTSLKALEELRAQTENESVRDLIDTISMNIRSLKYEAEYEGDNSAGAEEKELNSAREGVEDAFKGEK